MSDDARSCVVIETVESAAVGLIRRWMVAVV